MRLLIVDDVAQVREGLRIVLPLAAESAGLELEIAGEACDGAEAIRMAEQLQPDAVLMDLEMPGVDGFNAAQAIKESNLSIRLVALTVHTSREFCQKALNCGFDDFIEKGAAAEQVVNRLAQSATNKSEDPY